MADMDKILFQPLEKAIDTDFDDAQAYLARSLANVARYNAGAYDFDDPLGIAATMNGGHHRVGGLQVVYKNGAEVTVIRGYLAKIEGGDLRLGINDANVDLVIPDPGGGIDRYYLVQAEILESTVQEARELFNVGADAYDPPANINKRIFYTVQFSIVAGTSTQIPAPTGGAVGIGAFFFDGGGVLDADEIYDLRPLKSDFVGSELGLPSSTKSQITPLCREMRTDYASSNGVNGNWSAIVNGFLAHAFTRDDNTAGTGDTVDLTALMTETLVAGRWYYIYLAQNPRGQQVQNPVGRCTRVYEDRNLVSNCAVAVSSISPNSQGANSAPVPLARPFLGLSIGTGEGGCVGVVRRNDANTGWHPMTCSRGGSVHMQRWSALLITNATGTPNGGGDQRYIQVPLATGGFGGERALPVYTRSIRGSIGRNQIASAGTNIAVEFWITPVSAGSQIWGLLGPWESNDFASKYEFRFDVPHETKYRSPTGNFNLTMAGFTVTAGYTFIDLSGMNAANEWELYFDGFDL